MIQTHDRTMKKEKREYIIPGWSEAFYWFNHLNDAQRKQIEARIIKRFNPAGELFAWKLCQAYLVHLHQYLTDKNFRTFCDIYKTHVITKSSVKLRL